MPRSETTAALVLASDAGSGFTVPKYLATHRGRPLLEAVMADVRDWPIDEVFVVLGSGADAVLGSSALEDATIIVDPEWQEGVVASLRVGLDALSRDRSITRVVLVRGDQPAVPRAVVSSLLDLVAAEDALAAVPKYRYARGWPIAIAEELYPRLMGLEGDVEVLDVLAGHPDWVVEEWFDLLEPHRVATADDVESQHRH